MGISSPNLVGVESESIRITPPRRDYSRPNLTANQERFAQLLALNGVTSQAEAYRLAYACKPEASKQYVAEQASRLAHKSQVVARVREIRQEEAEKEQRSIGLDGPSVRTFVMGNLYRLATQARSEQVQFSASKALGEVASVGLFLHRTETVHLNIAGSDLQHQIAERLRGLFGPTPVQQQQLAAADVIEVQAIEAPEPAVEPEHPADAAVERPAPKRFI